MGLDENCNRKNHGDWQHAIRSAKRLNRRRRGTELTLVFAPYICVVCGGVHVGSLPHEPHRPRVDDGPDVTMLRRVRCLADALVMDGPE